MNRYGYIVGFITSAICASLSLFSYGVFCVYGYVWWGLISACAIVLNLRNAFYYADKIAGKA